jgi:hypothetical protein
MKFSQVLASAFIFATLGACSQGRESLLAGDKSKWWGPQMLCQNGDSTSGANCFELSINLTYNEAYFYVESIEPLAVQLGYRVAVRFEGEDENSFEVIGSGLDYRSGEEFTLPIGSRRDITQVAEWLVETEQNSSRNGLNFESAGVTFGIPLANAIIDWEELFTGNTNFLNNSGTR